MRTLLSILIAVVVTTSLQGATFTVNDAGTADDGACDAAHCSLREAVNAANAAAGADLIAFSIGTGPQEIAETVMLTVTDSVTIDGTTQPGYVSAPLITLRRSSLPVADLVQAGFFLDGGGQSTTIRGLAVHNYRTSGIHVNGTVGSITIEDNDIRTPSFAAVTCRGIYFDADVTDVVIRGNVVRSSSVANAQNGRGIYLFRMAGGTALIEDNIVGLAPDGMTPDVNDVGVYISGLVTTPVTIRGNVIGSNVFQGIVLASSGHTVEGNMIGLAADGSTPRPNHTGVGLSQTATAAIRNNTIAHNEGYGLVLVNTSGGIIQGNTITANSLGGIYLESDGTALIGGTAAEGNLIASNGGPGINVVWGETSHSLGNRIEGNRIHSNAGLGIDLFPAVGVTANDAGDADSELGNHGQNFPVITSAVSSGSSFTVNGELDSEALQAFRICVYGNTAAEPSNPSQGEVFLGCTVVNTDAAGEAAFSLTASAPPVILVTATATALSGASSNSTSEFSPAISVVQAGELQFTATSYGAAENGGSVAVVVQRTGGSAGTVTAAFTTSNGTALAGSDYTGTNTIVTFTDGDTALKTVHVPVVNDGVSEPAEAFTVTLSNPTGGASIGSQNMTVATIADNDPLPDLTISDVSVAEGDAGGVTATFNVTLSGSTAQQVTVGYATASVTAGAPADYTAASGTLVFATGTTSQTVVVTVNGDLSVEGSETFQVNLSSPVNATIADGQGIGTVIDDDAAPSVSIGDVTAAESETAVFTVTLSNASGATVTVDYATANGTAAAGQDYFAAAGQLTFAPGDTTKSVTIALVDDAVTEGSEAFVINLGAPVNAAIADGQAQGTISDNDATPSIAIDDVSMVEGSASMTFTVRLTNPSTSDVTAMWSTANGTATSGSDYLAASAQSLTIPAGQTSATLVVTLLADAVVESNEDFFVDLSAPVNATAADAQGRGSIIDDDGTPALTISDASAVEGTGTMQFTVTLAPSSAQSVSVSYQTGGGTASTASDYTAASGTLTFDAGQTSKAITVTVNDDAIAESPETLLLDLSAPANATIARAQATGTIADDDAQPSISIGDITVAESGSAVVTVSLSNPGGATTTVGYATADGTAVAGQDYVASAGQVTFAPGETTKTIAISLIDDAVTESSESFTIHLSNPVNATFADSQGEAAITDDDGTPSVSIGDVEVAESGAAVFTVTLSHASSSNVSVTWSTADGTAIAGADYAATAGQTLTIPAGATTGTISVALLADAVVEGNEDFFVDLSAPLHATIADAQGRGTILDDDDPPVPVVPSLSIYDVTVAEGDGGVVNATFTVSLSSASASTVSVAYATANGTALSGADYTAVSGTLTFAPGVTAQTIAIAIVGDVAVESSETFTVTLSAPSNATLADPNAAGSIVNDDVTAPPPPPPPPPGTQPPDVTIDPAVEVSECTDGAGVDVMFTVRASAPAPDPIHVALRTVDGTAAAGSDYQARSTVVTIPAGAMAATVAVRVLCDALDEPDETFFVALSEPEGGRLRSAMAAATIADDDVIAPERRAFAGVVGSTAGLAGAQFRTSVRLFNASELPITGKIVYHPAGSAAGEDDPSIDYTLQPGQSRFFDDFLAALGMTGLGTIDVVSLDGDLPLTFLHIFDDRGADGTTGFIEDAFTPSSALRAGERGVLFVPADLEAFRFNAGVRTMEDGADFDIEVRSERGEVRFRAARSLPAGHFAQTGGNEFAGTTLQPGDAIVLIVRRGAVIAYGATVDNRTNDPSAQFILKMR
jgi:CSLREA domain-containing protein